MDVYQENDQDEEYAVPEVVPYIDGDEVKELEEMAEDLELTTDSDNDEEQPTTPAPTQGHCTNNKTSSTNTSAIQDSSSDEDEKFVPAPPVKMLRNFNEVLGVGKHVDLPQAKRNARKKKKLVRKQQMWEAKVKELESKTRALRAPYLKKSIKDFRKLIQRDNPFQTPQAWLPPKWTPRDPQQDTLTLQLVDIDDINSTAEQWHVRWRPTDLDTSRDFNRDDYIPEHERVNMEVKVVEGREQRPSKTIKKPQHSVPVLRMHCLDQNGAPVMVRAHCFRPYFYARVPAECQTMSPSWLCAELAQFLEMRLEKDSFVKGQKVISVTIEQAQSVMGFHFTRSAADGQIVSKTDQFFKIILAMPGLVQNCKNILNPYKKHAFSGASIRHESDPHAQPFVKCLDLFECEKTLPFTFITDHKLPGQTWFSLPVGTYQVTTDAATKTNYKVEIDTRYDTIQVHDSGEERYSSIAPIRFMSFDIECASKNGHFPKPERDPVISIAVVVQDCSWKHPPLKAVFSYKICKDEYDPSWKSSTQRGEEKSSPTSKKRAALQVEKEDVFMTATAGEPEECIEDEDSTDDDPNDVDLDDAEMWMCEDEEDMLLSFSEFIRDCAPGVITGYNSSGFDIPYLLNRAQALDLEGFPFWGATLEPVLPEYSMFNSAAWGQQERCNIDIPGMILYDFLRWIRPEIKLKSYTLNSVAAHILKQTKDDLHHSLIPRMFYGPAHARRRLFKYNLKDAILPLLMIQKRLSWMRDTEMSRVCNVVLKWLTNRGQGVKTMSQLQPRMKAEKLLRPYTPKPPRSANADGNQREKFSGADVLEPKRGLNKNPVATLDYNSLYPSILITYNICYTTMIRVEDLHLLRAEDYNTVTIDEKTGEKRYFVKKHIREGLLPKILVNLLDSRAKAKTEMKAAKKALDQLMYEVLDSRQLALKVSANSVYGFPGAYMLPCPALSAAVTYYGRKLIHFALDTVEARFCVANGFEHNAKVLYGDTDSIMIDFGTKDLKLVNRLAKEAQDMLNAEFFKQPGNVVKIEFEKVYVNFLLLAAKNYAGYKFAPGATEYPPKELLGGEEYPLDIKGLESVRRDKIGLTQRLCEQVLIKCLRDNDRNGAIDYCKQEITKLLQGKIDISELILCKGLQLYYDEDSVQPAHARLAQKMFERDPESAPHTGDRVKYVLIVVGKKAQKSEQAEEPYFAMVNHLPIDYLGYFNSYLKNALKRLLEPIIAERLPELWELPLSVRPEQSLSGGGTSSGSLAAFLVPQGRCRNCRVNIPNQPNAIICKLCVPLAAKMKAQHLEQQQLLEAETSALWDNCKTCVGADSDERDCNNQDCQFWFKRWIKQDELKQSQKITKQLEMF